MLPNPNPNIRKKRKTILILLYPSYAAANLAERLDLAAAMAPSLHAVPEATDWKMGAPTEGQMANCVPSGLQTRAPGEEQLAPEPDAGAGAGVGAAAGAAGAGAEGAAAAGAAGATEGAAAGAAAAGEAA